MKEGQNRIALCKKIGQMKKQTCFLREERAQKVGLLELVNCGRGICGGKLMEDKDYFSKACLADSISCSL